MWHRAGLGHPPLVNLVLLCSRHHRLHHAGAYGITMVDGRPLFRSRDGTTIAPGDPPTPRPLRPAAAATDPARRTGEPLTRYGIDVLVTHLLAAA